MSKELVARLMQTTTQNLAERQHNALKQHVLEVLTTFTDHIRNQRYDKAEEMLSHSPAGDDMGTDVDYIDFTYDPDQRGEGDIGTMLSLLKTLKGAMEYR